MATVTKDFRIKSGLVVEGAHGTINGSEIITEDIITGGTQTNIAVTYDAQNGKLNFVAENGVADSTTSDLTEGSNLYFTDERAQDAVAQALANGTHTNITVDYDDNANSISLTGAVTYTDTDARNAISDGDGISYNSTTGVISADLVAQGGLTFSNGQTEVDRSVVDTWYDASGSASSVASDLSDHISDTSTHGVTGDIVGTTDVQSISNKTLQGPTYFQSAGGAGGTNNYVDVNSQDGKLTIHSGYELDVTSSGNLTLTSNGGDILLNPDGAAYITSVSAGNKIVTQNDLDTLSAGLSWKEAAHLLWDDANATTTGTSGTLSIDGHQTLTSAHNGYRILIINGTNAGIWTYSDNDTSWTITRSEDANSDAELQGAAIFIMEGTTYGSTSWVQSNQYISNLVGQDWHQFSGNGSVIAGTGITVDGLTVSIDRTTTDPWYDEAGAASQAETNANLYTDGEITTALETAQGYADTAESNAKAYADALTTADVAEDPSALYFTNSRAVSALQAVTPVFTEIDINSVAKQVAATVSAPTAGGVVGYSFAKTAYRSAEFLVKVAYSTHTELSKVVLTLDTSDNIAITEYAVVGTNGSLSSITAEVLGSNVNLVVTTGQANSTVTVVGTLLI